MFIIEAHVFFVMWPCNGPKTGANMFAIIGVIHVFNACGNNGAQSKYTQEEHNACRIIDKIQCKGEHASNLKLTLLACWSHSSPFHVPFP